MVQTMKQLLGISALVLCFRSTSSFSLTQFSPAASSSLRAYHFGAGAVSTEKPAAKKKYTSYVPDGLSEEEYRQIKLTEKRKEQKMQYGAWGPRFVS